MAASAPFSFHDVDLGHGVLRIADAGPDDGDERRAPLVLVHGLSSSHACWSRAVPHLESGRRVLAPDLPGFGGSDPVGEGFDAAEVAGALSAALRELGADHVDLVGHSLGGLVATVLADRHPEQVRRLVLAAAAGVDPYKGARLRVVGDVADRFMRLRRRYGPGLVARPRGRALMFAGVVADPVALAPSDAELLVRCSHGATRTGPALQEALATDLRPRLARLTAPVGAVWGEQDRLIPAVALAELEMVRPGAPVRTVADAAHVPMVERPEAFARALDGLLEALAHGTDTHVPQS